MKLLDNKYNTNAETLFSIDGTFVLFAQAKQILPFEAWNLITTHKAQK